MQRLDPVSCYVIHLQGFRNKGFGLTRLWECLGFGLQGTSKISESGVQDLDLRLVASGLGAHESWRSSTSQGPKLQTPTSHILNETAGY